MDQSSLRRGAKAWTETLMVQIRRACGIGLLLLSGCSALQIDVDVYKGPLVSQDEVQREQLVAMAMSAKTLLYTMRNSLFDRACSGWSSADPSLRGRWFNDAPRGEFKGCLENAATDVNVRRARRINDILSAYEDRPSTLAAAAVRSAGADDGGFSDGRIDEGIDRLANKYAVARDKATQARGAVLAVDPESAVEQTSRAAFRRLMHALVDLAGRIQFLTTNLWLIDGSSGKPSSWDGELPDEVRHKALLESIANNLVVHADDIRRQDDFASGQRKAAAAEALGADTGFAVDAAAQVRNIELSLADARAAASAAEAANDAEKPEGPIGKARAALKSAESEAESATAALEAALKAATGMSELARTVGPGKSAVPAPAVVAAADSPEAWLADQTALKKAFGAAGGEKIDIEALRDKLADWLTNEVATYSSPARDALPRNQRLKAAVDAIAALKPKDAPKPDAVAPPAAWAELVRRVQEARDNAFATWSVAARTKAEKAQAVTQRKGQVDSALAQVQQALRAAARRPSADYAATQVVLDELKGKALAELRASGATPSLTVVQAKLRSTVQAASAAQGVTAEAAKRYNTADAVLLEVVVSPPLASGVGAPRNIDVLDGVIAQLRYRHLELLRIRGKDDAETQRALASLEAAQVQRRDMVYLRPAASYLRSVYAASVTQAGSAATRWQNMLMENFLPFRLAKNAFSNAAELNQARAELDKVYWQNINSVKVGAAGSSNFVIAKDDVGNWYVKAMGSDPAAMVRAAKNLALFNAGSGLNTDLLRANELRTRIDAENDLNKRTEMRGELDGLTGSTGGATVTERSRTLTLFRKNYQDLSEVQRESLWQRIGAQEFRNAITPRWAVSLADSDATARAELLKVFDTPEPTASYQTAIDALAADPAAGSVGADSATRKAVGDKLLAALRAMQTWRGQIKAAVTGANGLIANELAAKKAATMALEAALRDRSDAVARRDLATKALAAARKDLNALEKTAPQELRDEVDGRWNTARSNYDDAVAKTDAADKLAADRQTELDKAIKLLDAAKARQQSAVADVDAVVKTAIDEIVKQRLQLVRDTETAVKIVGGSGQ